MTSAIYLASLAVVAVFFATPPGPSQLLMLSNSARHGAQRSLWTAFGDLTANALQMTAAGFGLAVIIAASDIALDVVKWAGVAYLVWMGVRTFRSTGSGPATAAASTALRRVMTLSRPNAVKGIANHRIRPATSASKSVETTQIGNTSCREMW